MIRNHDHTPVILLVEDNPDHAELILRSFEDHGLTARLVHIADGEAALSYLLRRPPYADPALNPRPDAILLDLRLPKVDGLEVLKVIKAHVALKRIPVVVLTTSAAERDVNLAYEHYANSYLVKPMDFTAFTRLIDDFCQYWLDRNRAPAELI